MARLVVGYAQVSRFGSDGEGQREVLLRLGMARPRPGLGEALAATRDGDTLVVTALARLARLARLVRSVPGADQLLTRLLGDQPW